MTTSPDAPARVRDLSLLAAAVTVVLWASAFVGIRAVGDAFSPGPLALGRLLVGALVLGVVAWPRRGPWPRGRTLVYVLGFGALWFGAYNVALNAGEQHVDAGTAALLVQLGPILIAVLAGLFQGEGFPPTLVAGIAVAFCGVALIAFGSGDGGLAGDRLGVLLCVAAAVLYAAGVLLQKPALRTLDGLQATWFGCLVGAAVCLPYLPALVGEARDASAGARAGVVYLGVFPTAIAFTTWAYALRRLGAGRTSATTYLVPAIAVLLSWALLGETPTAIGFAGGALCLAGVAITRMRRRTV